jgi:hypothetical protein
MRSISRNPGPVKPRSPFCAGLEWTQGNLNDSSYQAFCKCAGSLFNAHPPHVISEVAALTEAAGDTVKKDKLVEQFADAFRFVANDRAAETLNAPELKRQRVAGHRDEGKWPAPEPELIASVHREFADSTLARWRMVAAICKHTR